MKKFIAGFLSGAIIFSVVGVFAVNSIYDNPYKIIVNGVEKSIQGYNIDDYSYFKLRDIADAVGGFTVDFDEQNQAIVLSTDGEQPADTTAQPAPMQSFSISESDIQKLSEICVRLPDFDSGTVTGQEFADAFIFGYYTGIPTNIAKSDQPGCFGWSKSVVREDFSELFGAEMYDTAENFSEGYYWVTASNAGDERYVIDDIQNTADGGMDVVFRLTDSLGEYYDHTRTMHLTPAENANGYIIVSIK